MKSILKIALGTLLGIFLFFSIGFLFLFFSNSFLFPSKKKIDGHIKTPTILQIKLDSPIIEGNHKEDFSLENFSLFSSPSAFLAKKIELRKLLNVLNNALKDENIKVVSLEIGMGFDAGPTQLKDIREALMQLRKTKKIYAYGQQVSQKAYYLASIAHHISLHPTGYIDLKGIASYSFFYKRLMDSFLIEPVSFKTGKYKTFTEPYFQVKMSQESKDQTKELLDFLWNRFCLDIQTLRPLKKEWIDNLNGWFPDFAKENGLVDDLSYYDEFQEKLTSSLAKKSHPIDMFDYAERFLKKQVKKDKIALVYLSGPVIEGDGKWGIQDGYYRKIFSSIKENPSIKAVVVRINSPGGSFYASENIYRELILLKQKKPMVVSMGDFAASGGYFIAMASDDIFASPLSITGSIGVFTSPVFNIDKLLRKIGVDKDSISTNKNALVASFFEEDTPELREIKQNHVNYLYKTFISQVDKTRGNKLVFLKENSLNKEEQRQEKTSFPIWEKSLAQGRVWIGEKSHVHGLVDKLGSLEEAIDFSANKAKLTPHEYQIEEYPKKEDYMGRLMQFLADDRNQIYLKWAQKIGLSQDLLEELYYFKNHTRAHARIFPFSFLSY